MSLVSNIADVVTQIGGKLKALTARVTAVEATAGTALQPGALTGYAQITGATKIAVVTALPGSPDSSTVYLVTT